MKFAYTKKINSTFLETLDDLIFWLSDIWFWVVSNIDISEKIIKKVTSNFWEYRVLWVCNPEIAYKFLEKNLEYGVFLPCTIAVYEELWSVKVSLGLPDVMISNIIKNSDLEKFSKELTLSLKKVIDNL